MTTFNLGQIVATPSALEQLNQLNCDPLALLSKHSQCDWGDCCEEDKQSNDEALTTGDRLFSVYLVKNTKFWIITEAVDDTNTRQTTTLMLPSDY
jgi:hypothetical protein